MGLTEILVFFLLVLGGWILWGNLKAREIANGAIRGACKQYGILFLDDTVALESVWPVRDENGQLRLRRIYRFEYSDTGDDRRQGTVTMITDAVRAVDVGPPPGVESGTPR